VQPKRSKPLRQERLVQPSNQPHSFPASTGQDSCRRAVRIVDIDQLNLRIKPRKRLVREKPRPLAVPQAINQVWSMDFMHDRLEDGRNLRLFNVIDDFKR
jgi:transposase InsO family protein